MLRKNRLQRIVDQGRLTATRRAHQKHELAVVYLKGDAAHRLCTVFVGFFRFFQSNHSAPRISKKCNILWLKKHTRNIIYEYTANGNRNRPIFSTFSFQLWIRRSNAEKCSQNKKVTDKVGHFLSITNYASMPRLVRYFFTMRATLKVMASSNSRRSRPVSFLIFSRRYTSVLRCTNSLRAVSETLRLFSKNL